MIDVEAIFASEVEAIVPRPGSFGSDWRDVERRAELSSRRRRHVLLVAALLATVFVAVALANTFGGFSTWLAGEPGKPASTAAQRAFAAAIRSWDGFPSGTELRQLVRTTAGGNTFTLYGFRGSGSLCLRLDVSGRTTTHELICPPLTQLRGSAAPALPASVDYPVGTGARLSNGPFDFTLPGAAVTFGIVADAVTTVQIDHNAGGSTKALVAGDAFLSVVSNPSPAEHVIAILAGNGNGNTTVQVPFSSTASQPSAVSGPTQVQRVIQGGAISWFAHRQPRGTAIAKSIHHIIGVSPSVTFAREITPNLSAPERIVVSISPAGTRYFGGHLRNNQQVCAEVVGGRYPAGGGCWPAGRLFSTAPFALGVEGTTSSQYVTVAGLASDDVARLTLFPSSNKPVPVPLHDNGYLVEVPISEYPLNLVAYDDHGLVIGTKAIRGSQAPSLPTADIPNVRGTWTRVAHNDGGEVWVGPSLAGSDCVVIRYDTERLGPLPSCQPEPQLAATAIGQIQTITYPSTNRQDILVTVGVAITHLSVHLQDAAAQTIIATHGYALAALAASAHVTSVTAYDQSGRAVSTRQITGGLIGGRATISQVNKSSLSFASGHVTCRLTADSPPVSAYRNGTHVQYLCRDGVLTLIGRSSPNAPTVRARSRTSASPLSRFGTT